MRDYENPTHIPPLPLKIIACAFILWFVIVPSIVLIRTRPIIELPLNVMAGLTLTGMALGFLFIHRLILWFYYTFFWYILAAFAVGSAFCAATVAVGLFTLPTIPPLSSISTPLQALTIPGAIFGLIALILVFRSRSHAAAPTPQPQLPAAPPVPANPKPAVSPKDQLDERRRKLGM